MAKIKDIFKITKGRKVQNSFTEGNPSDLRYIQIEDLRNDTNIKYTDEKKLVAVDENDVIIAWDGAYAGTVGFGLTGIIGSTLARLRIRDNYTDFCNPRYLGFFLRTKFEHLQNTSTGATIPHISKNALTDIEIPIPDLEIQNRIVAILDKANTLIEKRERSIILYDELIRAIFYELFGDPLDKRRPWNTDSIGKHVQAIVAGTSYGGETKDHLDEDELGVLKISAVTKGVFDSQEFKAVKKQAIKKQIVNPRKNDLLFSRANTIELVGACCIVDKDYNDLFLPDKIWKIVTDENQLKKTYLCYVLQSRNMRDSFVNIATGSSGSMLNISMNKFKAIQIPIPPVQLQEKFEAIYFKYRDYIEKLLASKHKIETLQKALSQQSFVGKSQFDIDLEIEAILDSFDLRDITYRNKRSIVSAFNMLTKDQTYFQRVLDKLDEQEYSERELYNKAKAGVFRALKKEINGLQQVFTESEGVKKIKLTFNEVTST